MNSAYTVSVKTLRGNQVVLRNGSFIGLEDGHEWVNVRTELQIKLGESTTVVNFDKIKTLRLKGGSKAQMTTTSGKIVDIEDQDESEHLEIWVE